MKTFARKLNLTLLFLAALGLMILPACKSTSSSAQYTKKGPNDEEIASSSGSTTKTTVAKNNSMTVPAEMMEAELKSLDGTTFRLSDFRGKVVLINLWATWCGFCKKEMPDLVALNEEYKDRNVEFIGLNVDDEELPQVEEFVRQYEVTYRIGWTNEDVYSVLRPRGIPSTYIITPDGQFHWAVSGAVPQERIKKKLEEALNVQS
jgi:thiol-disulfide isomerase/thioredoxin